MECPQGVAGTESSGGTGLAGTSTPQEALQPGPPLRRPYPKGFEICLVVVVVVMHTFNRSILEAEAGGSRRVKSLA